MWYKSSLHLTVQKSWKFTGNIQYILGKVQVSAIVLNFMWHVLHSLNPRLSHCKIIFINKKVKATVFHLRCALVQSSFRQGSPSCGDNMDLCMFAFLQSQKCNGFLSTKNTLSHLYSLWGFFVEATSLLQKIFWCCHTRVWHSTHFMWEWYTFNLLWEKSLQGYVPNIFSCCCY